MYLVVPFICPDRIIIEQTIESHQMFDLCVAHASRNVYTPQTMPLPTTAIAPWFLEDHPT